LFLNEIAIFKNKLFTAAPIFSQGVTIFLARDDITRFDGTGNSQTVYLSVQDP
jgi:hypothetical protein